MNDSIRVSFLSLGLKVDAVIFPFMVQGHLIPFLALPRKLQQRSIFSGTAKASLKLLLESSWSSLTVEKLMKLLRQVEVMCSLKLYCGFFRHGSGCDIYLSTLLLRSEVIRSFAPKLWSLKGQSNGSAVLKDNRKCEHF